MQLWINKGGFAHLDLLQEYTVGGFGLMRPELHRISDWKF